MQISRNLLLTCAVAACLTPILVHAADNEAQIRARQALEEKMKEMPAPTAPTNPAPAMSKPKAATRQKPAPPVVTAPSQNATAESQPAPTRPYAPSTDPATRQKLEDALHQNTLAPQPVVQAPPQQPAMAAAPNAAPAQSEQAPSNDATKEQKLENALHNFQPQPNTAVRQVEPSAQPAQPPVTAAPRAATVQSQPAQSMPSYISTPSNDEATNQKLEEALKQKIQQTPAEATPPAMATQKPAKSMNPPPTAAPKANYATQPAPTPAPAANYAPVPTATTTHPNLPEMPTPTPSSSAANRNQPAPPTMSLPALSGPPTGLSAAKQQKLDELLNQYRADQITPQQYHEQRAKILAEP